MRGFPLVNLLMISVVLAALLIPLLRLNTPARAVDASESSTQHGVAGAEMTASALVPVTVSLRFVSEPAKLEMKAEDRSLTFAGTGLEWTAHAELPLRDGALELDTAVTWPVGSVGSVVEVSVAPDGRAELRQNLWADGAEASDILRFDWKK